MVSPNSGLRALAIYALVLPLALMLGYMLATPTALSSAGTIGIVLALLVLPLVLKYHHQVLFLSWGMTAIIFFLPGTPPLWLLMAFVSLVISLAQRALSREQQFIWESSLIWPIVFLVIVVLVTAKATGGIGLRMFGSGTVGGRRYVLIFAGIAGFLAMTAQRIPAEKSMLYVGLFFLGTLTDALGTLIPYGPSEFYPLAWVFPVSMADLSTATDMGPGLGFNQGITRFFGLTLTSLGLLWYMLARNGMRGIMSHPFRFAVFIAVLIVGSLGGFRSFLILTTATCLLVFYFEGLFRSRYLAWLILALVMGGSLLVAFSDRLPLALQRTLSFLPLKIQPIARFDAEVSSEWRLQIWNLVLPEVPRYLWLGKGLGIDAHDMSMASALTGTSLGSSQEEALLAGDYHSGPLTVLIQFGIWGFAGWLWLLGAGVRALYLNYRYGESHLRDTNTMLLAYFIGKIILFFIVFGNFNTDVPQFCGLLGLSLSLNHGICRPERVPAEASNQTDLAGLPESAVG